DWCRFLSRTPGPPPVLVDELEPPRQIECPSITRSIGAPSRVSVFGKTTPCKGIGNSGYPEVVKLTRESVNDAHRGLNWAMSKLRKEIQRWCDYTRYTKSQPAGSYTFRSEIGSNCIHSAPRWREHFKNRRSNCTKLLTFEGCVWHKGSGFF